MKNEIIFVLVTIVISVLVVAPGFGAPGRYEVVILGTLGGDRSRALGINDAGQVVGESTTTDGHHHAFLWQDGVMTDMGVIGTGPYGAEISCAKSINNYGQAVGYSALDVEWPDHAFLWEDGQMVDLGTFGGYESSAACINNVGQIVGRFTNSSGQYRAFLWENGSVIDIGNLDGGYAYGINDNGQVVGMYYKTSTGSMNGFEWSNGITTDLGAIDEYGSVATAINNAGIIVGWVSFREGEVLNTRPVLWENYQMMQLGELDEPTDWIRAHAINDKGQVVGEAAVECPPCTCAWLWENGEMSNLHKFFPADIQASGAFGINNGGQIVGTVELDSEPRGFIMTPVIQAEASIKPKTLNLNSKGKWISCNITLGEDYNVADIDANSILLEDEISPDRVVLYGRLAVAKFSRSAVQELLSDLQTPAEVELLVSGQLTDGTIFYGTDTITVKRPPMIRKSIKEAQAARRLRRNNKSIINFECVDNGKKSKSKKTAGCGSASDMCMS